MARDMVRKWTGISVSEETCQRLSERFHIRILTDERLRPMFPADLARLTTHFTLFLVENLGGPARYTAQRGKQSLLCRHAHLKIGTAESDAWLGHMFEAIDEVGIEEPVRQRLRDHFTQLAESLTDPLLPLYHLPLDELKAMLVQNPAVARTATTTRSLLSDAASRWDHPRVQLLLSYGADATLHDRAGHDALYYATNAGSPDTVEAGLAVVDLLIQHGADVNGQAGVTRSTPLHMTARRGHVALAEALLLAGADIEAVDSKGQTPLRRALNCRQTAMVQLLGAHTADLI